MGGIHRPYNIPYGGHTQTLQHSIWGAYIDPITFHMGGIHRPYNIPYGGHTQTLQHSIWGHTQTLLHFIWGTYTDPTTFHMGGIHKPYNIPYGGAYTAFLLCWLWLGRDPNMWHSDCVFIHVHIHTYMYRTKAVSLCEHVLFYTDFRLNNVGIRYIKFLKASVIIMIYDIADDNKFKQAMFRVTALLISTQGDCF